MTSIFLTHELGDLDLQLYDTQRQLLTESISLTDEEHVEWEVTGGESYYLRVYGPRASISPRYLIGPRFYVDDGFLQSNYAFSLLFEPAALLPGDLNGDGYVGSADLDIVRSHWNDIVPPGSLLDGDPSGDGKVGSADLDIVRANWGAHAVAATASSDSETQTDNTGKDASPVPAGAVSQMQAGSARARAEAAWAQAIEALARGRHDSEEGPRLRQAVDLILSGLAE